MYTYQANFPYPPIAVIRNEVPSEAQWSAADGGPAEYNLNFSLRPFTPKRPA
jgi:hypothetical protein